MTEENEIKQNPASVPVLIYIACTLGVLGTVPTLLLRYTELAYMVGRWYLNFLLISSMLIWLSLIVVWKMNKSGALFYILIATGTEIILFKYNVMWSYTSIIIPFFVTAIILRQYKRLS